MPRRSFYELFFDVLLLPATFNDLFASRSCRSRSWLENVLCATATVATTNVQSAYRSSERTLIRNACSIAVLQQEGNVCDKHFLPHIISRNTEKPVASSMKKVSQEKKEKQAKLSMCLYRCPFSYPLPCVFIVFVSSLLLRKDIFSVLGCTRPVMSSVDKHPPLLF